jgi:hypothetical protein
MSLSDREWWVVVVLCLGFVSMLAGIYLSRWTTATVAFIVCVVCLLSLIILASGVS